MTAQRVLFIGGTGVISAACARQAVMAGFDLSVLNRGMTTVRAVPPEARVLTARQIIEWHDAEAGRRHIDHALDATIDRLVEAYETGRLAANADSLSWPGNNA